VRFTLPQQQRILLTLRGPAPSCRTVGTVRVRGVRGVNRLDFFGRIGGKALRRGVYVLSLTRASSKQPLTRPLVVQVVSPRRTILLSDVRAPRTVCDVAAGFAGRKQVAGAAGAAAAPLFGAGPGLPAPAFDAQQSQQPPTPASAPASETRAAAPQAAEPPRPERNKVLGVNVDLPALPAPDEFQPWGLAGAVLLVGLPLLVLLMLVARFLRGSWNP
jgi:hypothetical protein